MSFRIVDTTIQQISSSGSSLDSSGSCVDRIEQLQQNCWPEPDWWQAGGGDKQQLTAGSSCLEEWQQMMPLDENNYGGTFEEVPVCNVEEIELDVDELEQRMSDNLWMMAAGSSMTTTTAPGAPEPRICEVEPLTEQQVEDISAGLMSPAAGAYDLQEEIPLQHDEQLQYLTTGDSVETTLDSLEPLSGSWIDTTSYIDQMATFEEFTETTLNNNNPTDNDINPNNTCDNQFSATIAASSYEQFDCSSEDKSVESLDIRGCSSACVESKLYFDSANVAAGATLNDEEVAAEEITQQLFRAVNLQTCSGTSQVQLEELLAQLFGRDVTPENSNPGCYDSIDTNTENSKTLSGSSVDNSYFFDIGSAVDSGCFLEHVGSAVDLKSLEIGSTVDVEALWNVDSGYHTATTSPTTSEVPALSPSPRELTADSAAAATGSYNRKRPASDKISNESDTDDDNDDDYSYIDDDDDDDEDFVPTSYLSSKLTDSSRRRQKRSTATRSGRGKRKRREEYALLTPEERRERKREQNKNAATKYRDKKRQEELEHEEACEELERRNMELRREVADKEREVKVLRRLVINIFRQPPSETVTAMSAAAATAGPVGGGRVKRNVKRELLIRELMKNS